MKQEQFDACMKRICNGDRNALREIYEEYLGYIFSVIYRVVDNHDDAEDITADFFVKFWTGADKYIAGTAHKAYMATIARNMAIDHLRKNNREVLTAEFVTDSVDDDSVNVVPADITADSDISGSRVEQEVIEDISLREALDKLNPREREVINLKVMGDMTFREISEVTKAPLGTVTWLYRQAINKLRRCGYYDES